MREELTFLCKSSGSLRLFDTLNRSISIFVRLLSEPKSSQRILSML